MGCMSSKEVARSISVRENRDPRIQAGSASVTWEELLASHSGSGKLFSFVATKLRSGSFTLPDPETTQAPKFVSLIPEINGKTDVEPVPGDAGEPNVGRFTRSRSCQVARDKDSLGLDPGTDENKIDWRGRNLAGSRSFHTVEEYDALLERIHKCSTTGEEQPFGDPEFVEGPRLINLAENQNHGVVEKEPGTKEDTNMDDDQEVQKNHENFEVVIEGDGSGETGWKRKTVAKGLKSLDVTSSVEFPGMARFRQRYRVEAGHIYSPGTYVTPKFGSYNAKIVEEKEGGQEDSVFSPELLAAFEDCMQQLQQEEDNILSHMDDYSQVDQDDVLEDRVDKGSIEHQSSSL